MSESLRTATDPAVAAGLDTEYKARWRRAGTNFAFTSLVYGTFALVPAVAAWPDVFGEASSTSIPQITIDLEPGAALLGVLTTVIIALNVTLWSGSRGESDVVDQHARMKVLQETATGAGLIAGVVGWAVVFDDLGGGLVVAKVCVLFTTGIIIVLAYDTSAALGQGDRGSIDQVLAHYQENLRRSRLIAARKEWLRGSIRLSKWRSARLVVTLLLLTLVFPALIGISAVRRNDGDLLQTTTLALGATVCGVSFTLYIIYGLVYQYATRNYAMTVFIALIGVTTVLAVVAAGWSVPGDGWRPWLTRLYLSWILLVPGVLMFFGFLRRTKMAWPGSLLRRLLCRQLTRLISVSERRESAATDPVPPRGGLSLRVARIQSYLRRISGSDSSRDLLAPALARNAKDSNT